MTFTLATAPVVASDFSSTKKSIEQALSRVNWGKTAIFGTSTALGACLVVGLAMDVREYGSAWWDGSSFNTSKLRNDTVKYLLGALFIGAATVVAGKKTVKAVRGEEKAVEGPKADA